MSWSLMPRYFSHQRQQLYLNVRDILAGNGSTIRFEGSHARKWMGGNLWFGPGRASSGCLLWVTCISIMNFSTNDITENLYIQQVGGQGFVTDCYSKFLSHKKIGSHIVQFWLCKLELAFLPKSNVPHININTLRHTGRYNKVLLQFLRTWSFAS